VWDGPSEGAAQVTDLLDEAGAPITTLTADDNGMIPQFQGPPDDSERLWVDFGAARVAILSTNLGDRFEAHLTDSDPHGSAQAALDAVAAQRGVPLGLATLDGAGKVPAAQLGQYRSGVYVPAGWGANWKAKRDAASTGKARVVVAGGSASQGYYASNLHFGGWVGNVRTALQAQYGDGGSGMFPASRTATYINGASDANALAAWLANKSVASQTGVWTLGGSQYGPGVTYVYCQTTGASITFRVTGTTVKIYTVTGASTRAGYTYSIDGAAAVTVADGGGSQASIQTTTVNGLSAGDHDVTLTWKGTSSGTGQFLSVCGVAGENSTGIVVDNLAKAGARASTYGTHTASALNAVWNGGANYPADLCIFTAGPNDAVAGTTGDVWASSVAKYFKAVRDANDGATDLMILLPHLGNHDVTNFLYQDYAVRARGLAEAYDAALVDMWTIGRNSWSYWNSLGYWGTASNVGATGTDSVHLSDTGYAHVASVVTPILMG
jgi:lysophospholipase L1-like esterase